MRQIDDLAVARRSLEAFRAEGASFDEAWPTVLSTLASRETGSVAERQDHDAAITALEALEGPWRAAFENRPPPPARYPDCGPYDPDLDLRRPRRRQTSGLRPLTLRELRKLFPADQPERTKRGRRPNRTPVAA